jgi:hypothetical protein
MELIVKPKCSICGTQKKETNNWFMAHMRVNDKILILPMPDYPSTAEVEMFAALCGQNCVVKYVSNNLEELHKHAF